ncbi:hypothetical protein ACWD6P_31905 [Streptomyces sp. NPDC002446]
MTTAAASAAVRVSPSRSRPGNYLGAMRRWVATLLLAAGLDPELCTVFVQSQVDEHVRLSYLMECTASEGEVRSVIQYEEKAARERARGGSVPLSLLTRPVLRAVDILAYGTRGALKKDAAEVVVEGLRPVRKRHAELAADPSYVEEVLRVGAERARGLARPRVDAAYRAVGLLA